MGEGRPGGLGGGALGLPRGAALLEGGGQVGEDRAPGTREQGSASVWPPRAVPFALSLAGRGITGYLRSWSPRLGFILPQRKAHPQGAWPDVSQELRAQLPFRPS